MNTPVADFVRRYGEGDTARMHMPGHKGRPFLGCEPWDLTEIPGADALYQAQGILRESEENAAALFGSQRTCYSTEGSSQCLRAMLYLACCGTGSRRVVAARNVHSAFVSAAALLDLEVTWLWPEESRSLCGCPVSPAQLEETLSRLPEPPAAVYLTSPDYLGAMAQLPALGEVCRRRGVLLLVDNAHGAYLRFLSPSLHPLDLGATCTSPKAPRRRWRPWPRTPWPCSAPPAPPTSPWPPWTCATATWRRATPSGWRRPWNSWHPSGKGCGPRAGSRSPATPCG